MAKKATKQELIKKEEEYISFLEKRIASVNYKANVSAEEYEQTKEKLKKAKFKLKTLKAT